MSSVASEIIRRNDRMAGVVVTGPPKARGRFMSGFGSALDVVVMAAGKGTRMKSSLPKVLHRVAGKAMVRHVLDTVESLSPRRVVLITGHGAEAVEASLAAHPLSLRGQLQFARQMPQLGTGHAVQQAVPLLPDDGVVLILNGDVPLIAADTVQALVQACAGQHLALLTVALDDPTGYGRILRQGEAVLGLPTTDEVQVAGVNSPQQLAALERACQARRADALMADGVRLADPARLDVRGTLQCGNDVEIDVNCVFEGQVVLGDGVRIGANCVIANAQIAAGAVIHPFTHIEGEKAGVQVGPGSLIGPFARLRPGA